MADLRAILRDDAMAELVEAFAAETGCDVSLALGRSRQVRLHRDGWPLLQLDAVMSANAAPPGIAAWRVSGDAGDGTVTNVAELRALVEAWQRGEAVDR